MTTLKNFALVSAALSLLIPAAMAADTTTTTTTAAPAAKPAPAKKATKKGVRLKKKATKIITNGVSQAGKNVEGQK